MIGNEKKNLAAALAELGAMSAGVFALSFLYGFNEYKSYLKALGVGWIGGNISPAGYAMHSTSALLSIAPYALLAFAMLKFSFPARFSRWFLLVCSLISLMIFFFAVWVVVKGYRTEATPTAWLVKDLGAYIKIVIGFFAAAIVVCLGDDALNKSWSYLSGLLLFIIVLVVFPRMTGEAEGVWVRTSDGRSLPYVIIDDVRWGVVDYQVGSSLLIKFRGDKAPLAMYSAVEGMVINHEFSNHYKNYWDATDVPKNIKSDLGE